MGRTDGDRVAIAADGQCVAHVSRKRPAAAEMVRPFTVRRLEIGELPQLCHRSLGRYWGGRPVRHACEDREADQAREKPDTHDHNGILMDNNGAPEISHSALDVSSHGHSRYDPP